MGYTCEFKGIIHPSNLTFFVHIFPQHFEFTIEDFVQNVSALILSLRDSYDCYLTTASVCTPSTSVHPLDFTHGGRNPEAQRRRSAECEVFGICCSPKKLQAALTEAKPSARSPTGAL